MPLDPEIVYLCVCAIYVQWVCAYVFPHEHVCLCLCACVHVCACARCVYAMWMPFDPRIVHATAKHARQQHVAQHLGFRSLHIELECQRPNLEDQGIVR